MAETDNWDIVTMWKAGCTPASLYADIPGPPYTVAECLAWYRWALASIEELHPDAMLISFFNVYANDTVAAKAESGIASLFSWANTVAEHTVFMLDSPLLESRPGDCLDKATATLRTCTAEWSGDPNNAGTALRGIAQQHHVGVIDPTGWFCYKGLCPLVIGHMIAFADVSHVTVTYATALGPPFRTAFRAALHAP
jgi:hypothetical protein